MVYTSKELPAKGILTTKGRHYLMESASKWITRSAIENKNMLHVDYVQST